MNSTALHIVLLSALLLLAAVPAALAQPCIGDCDGDGRVAIHEVTRGVRMNLGLADAAACPMMLCDDALSPPVSCLVAAVENALATDQCWHVLSCGPGCFIGPCNEPPYVDCPCPPCPPVVPR